MELFVPLFGPSRTGREEVARAVESQINGPD
jgi:hypothetical protein